MADLTPHHDAALLRAWHEGCQSELGADHDTEWPSGVESVFQLFLSQAIDTGKTAELAALFEMYANEARIADQKYYPNG
jgi:hypothetical protein